MRLRRKRQFYTAAESAEIWDRWQRGEGLKSISRVFGRLPLRSSRTCSLMVASGQSHAADRGWR